MKQIPEIKIKVTRKNADDMHTIRSSRDAEEVFRKVFDADTMLWREEFIMICLNRANEVVGFYKVSSGGVAGTVVDPKIVFTIALQSTASGIIIAHNHPSGQLKPSQSDMNITKKLVDAGGILEISVLDHLIITENGYLSFADEGLI